MYIPNDNFDSTKMRWDGCFVLIDGVITCIFNVLELTPSHLTYQGARVNDFYWEDRREKVPLSLVQHSFPPLGNLNVNNTVIFVRKSTEVSRKLGFHNERIKCTHLVDLVTTEISIPILKALMDRKYYSVEEALKRVEQRLSSALSPYISIVCHTSSVHINRGIDTIGVVKNGTVHLIKEYKLFSQELTELGLTVQVEEP